MELGLLPAADPAAWASAVIVAAHPDDEVLGVGGTMALLAAAGARLRLVAVTDGEASHPGADPAAMARARIAESAAALEALGVRDIEVIRLRLPDTGLAACEDELTSVLREQCAGFGICLAPWEADAHADHEAAGRAARRRRQAGQDVLSYPIWMWHWAIPGDRGCPGTGPAGYRSARTSRPGRKRPSGVHQPAHRPRRRRAAGPASRHRGAFHPATGGTAAMTAPVTLGAEYFDAMYQDAEDPWGFENRWYEQRKYAISLALLPARRYRSAFEPGCSIGVLTAPARPALRRPAVLRRRRGRGPGRRPAYP